MVVTPVPDDVWGDVLASDPESLAFQTRSWLDAICSLGTWSDASRLYQFPGGRWFLLPVVRQARRPAAVASQGSLPPGWGTGGLVGRDQPRPREVAEIFADLRRQPVLRTSVRPNPLQEAAWAAARPRDVVRVPRLAHVLDLTGGFDEVWATRFKGSARTGVRKAEKAGLVVESDTTGRLVPAYYRLYELSLQRWAAHQHEPEALARWRGRRRDSERKLAAITRSLGENCRIWLARLGERPVAGIVVVHAANASYTRGAMDVEVAGPTRANYLLHKLAIADACTRGCRRYHMGETGASQQLAQFKTRFGAVGVPYAEYHVERLPLTAADHRLRRAVKTVIGFRD
jgi:Acetyltransferase (GNAT) domain